VGFVSGLKLQDCNLADQKVSKNGNLWDWNLTDPSAHPILHNLLWMLAMLLAIVDMLRYVMKRFIVDQLRLAVMEQLCCSQVISKWSC
jgi:hypothetical protein